jgi:hypothetical protein
MRRTRAQRGFTVEQNGTMTSNSLSSCEVKHTEGTKLHQVDSLSIVGWVQKDHTHFPRPLL